MDIKAILNAEYGLTVITLSELDGDINYSTRKFYISDSRGNRYILRVYTDREELALAKEELVVLDRIKDHLPFKIPGTIPDKNNQLFSCHGNKYLRLTSYLDGLFMSEAGVNNELRYELGLKIADLVSALAGVESYIYKSRELFWDLQNTDLNFEKTGYIADPHVRKTVRYFFQSFRLDILPELKKQRRSIIHGDLNSDNILIDGKHIIGIIDFGDMSESYIINEIAIAAAYVMLDSHDPFNEVLALIRGFNSKLELSTDELRLLPSLIACRLGISVCNSAEKKALGSAGAYTLTSEDAATKLLKNWPETGTPGFEKQLFNACGKNHEANEIDTYSARDRRNRFMSKALSLSYTSPIYMHSALFQYMYDMQANSYLDAYNNIPHVGHSHPAVSDAIQKQSRKLNTNTRYIYDSLADYSEKLLGKFPEHLNRVFYVNSGSAASDLAVRLAGNYTGLSNLLVMEHGYHGNTSTGISISSYKFDGKGGKGLPGDITRLTLPKLYRGRYPEKDMYVREALGQIEELRNKGIVPAALITEPVSGCGGQVPLAPGYLADLCTAIKDTPTLVISDEVQVGFGRLGSWFWGFEMHDIVPDIVILGKPMGNGHPIGAVVTTREIADAFATGMEFFSSFGGNPVSCEAALAVMNVIEEEGLQENAINTGNYYIKCAKQLQQKHSVIGDVRGEGLFIGIEFTMQDGLPGTEVANIVKNELKERFILTGTDGPHNNVIKSKPPLCFNRANVNRVIENMDSILKSIIE